MTNYDVVKKLIGSIEPYGETNLDAVRLINLEQHIELVEYLLNDLKDTATFAVRSEYSIKVLGEKAYKYLRALHGELEEWL